MNVMSNDMYTLATTPEEMMLRRKLLFRLLRDAELQEPDQGGEAIDEPVGPFHVPAAAQAPGPMLARIA